MKTINLRDYYPFYHILVKAFVWRRERRNNESPVKHYYCALLPPIP